jgi:hypothetical protein
MGGSEQTAEEYLLGKQVTHKDLLEHGDKKDGKSAGGFYKKEIVPVIRQSNASNENEAFVRMMEDPLVHIKMKE